MEALSNTGAYGAHSLTVLSNVGSKTLPLYNEAPDVHFLGNAVYTNLPVPGAYGDTAPRRGTSHSKGPWTRWHRRSERTQSRSESSTISGKAKLPDLREAR